jgi:hypothetical protein
MKGHILVSKKNLHRRYPSRRFPPGKGMGGKAAPLPPQTTPLHGRQVAVCACRFPHRRRSEFKGGRDPVSLKNRRAGE